MHRYGFRMSFPLVTASLLAVTLLGHDARGEKKTGRPIAVIVSPKSPLKALTLAELRSVFLKQRSELKGKKIIPINLVAKDPLRVAFDRLVLHMNADQSGTYWVGRLMRGEGKPPRFFPSSALAQMVVSNLTFAIAYTWLEDISAKVKAIRIEGKRPGERGYPLVSRP